VTPKLTVPAKRSVRSVAVRLTSHACGPRFTARWSTVPTCRERSDPAGAVLLPALETAGQKTGRILGLGCLGIVSIVVVLWIIGSIMMAANPEKYGGGSSSAPSTSFDQQLKLCVEMQRKTGSLDAKCQEFDRKLGEVFRGAGREAQEKLRKQYGQ
jgi:hypothetical protein